MYLGCRYMGSEPLLGRLRSVPAAKSQLWEKSCPPTGTEELGGGGNKSLMGGGGRGLALGFAGAR